MRIRMRQEITGTFHGVDGGVPRGGIVDVDEFHARRYIKNGMAEAVSDGPKHAEESAVLDAEGESTTVKRRGRPKKQPEWHDEQAPGWSEGNPPQ